MRLVSGIKPTGSLTLGNYIGAISQFVALQETLENTEFFIFIADLHALTTPIEKKMLKQHVLEVAALYVACGLDPNRVNLFIQSEVPEHAQLAYIMESTVYIGELERMTQYKDKKLKQQADGMRASLFTYPALMAADILLYDADIVPVGEDQKQHLELTRDLAERFNSKYNDTFVVPKAYQPKTGARIKSLLEPTRKMDKSHDNPKSYILLLDDPQVIKNKIKSAVTDSDGVITYDVDNKPGISNLLTIYASLKQQSIEATVDYFKNKSYAELKEEVSSVIIQTLSPIQSKYHALIKDPSLHEILNQGRDKASELARRKLQKVYYKIGLLRQK
jgi:tryptophanyl-tRNA synthetase